MPVGADDVAITVVVIVDVDNFVVISNIISWRDDWLVGWLVRLPACLTVACWYAAATQNGPLNEAIVLMIMSSVAVAAAAATNKMHFFFAIKLNIAPAMERHVSL